MAEEKKPGTTQQTTIEVGSIEEILAIPTVDPNDEGKTKGNNIFSNKTPDMSFLEKINPEEEEEEEEDPNPDPNDPEGKNKGKKKDGLSFLNPEEDPAEEEEEEEEEEDPADLGDQNMKGKAGIISFTKKLIENNKLIPFQNEKGEDEDISNYKMKDILELYEANFQRREEDIRTEISENYIKTLPPELQIAHRHLVNGTYSIQNFMSDIANDRQARELDPANEADQEEIVSSYLRIKGHDEEEISEEIASLKDRNELGNRATKLKPKLENETRAVIESRLQEQETLKRKQEAQVKKYTDGVFEAINKGEINGIKLDRATQNALYAGLVQPTHVSSTGRKVNLLGHLLEKNQWIEPNHELMAEVLWLLSNPEEYREKIGGKVKKDTNASTFRKLKTSEKNKIGSSTVEDTDDEHGRKKKAPFTRPGNFFRRA